LNKTAGAGISLSQAVRGSLTFDALGRMNEATLWVESRPDRGGVRTLVELRDGHRPVDITPPGFDVGTTIHAYGGGAYCAGSTGIFVAGSDGGIYEITEPGISRLITSRRLNSERLYGDLVDAGSAVLCVQEVVGEVEEGDSLLAIPLDQSSHPHVLVRTEGFLAAPRMSGNRLAWLRWSVDTMPWDASELWLADWRPGRGITNEMRIAGGDAESVLEPRWGPDGHLYFMSDRSGWWNLYRWTGSQVVAMAPVDADCAAEPWEFGYSSYDFLSDGRIVMIVQEGPRHRLALVHPRLGITRIEVPYTSIKPYLAAYGTSVAMIASSPMVAPQVVRVRIDDPTHPPDVLASVETTDLGGLDISQPEQLRVPTMGGRQVMTLLYPPTGSSPGWRAPLIVRVHPGPTASSLLRLDWQVQFFTSRGFAVVDVDYIGSTGYGRTFRQGLYGRWGIDDVADCRAVAEHLLDTGRAIAGQVFISGASAGGYTSLQAVSEEGPFAAAVAISAIVDPDAWIHNAPRFQRPHAARLRSAAGAVHAEAIRRPVLLMHGARDDVAPPAAIAELARRLTAHSIDHQLVMFDDVGHYVASSAEAGPALRAELQLYLDIIAGRPLGRATDMHT
jgi:dipeptidyl aminopeptidase/acylaminoacyl peptidase